MTKITSKEQYLWALSKVEELLPLVNEDTPESDPNRIELELLSNLVADFSDENFCIGEPTLCDILKLRMYEMGLNQKSLADPTLAVARRISKKLNISASIVLGV